MQLKACSPPASCLILLDPPNRSNKDAWPDLRSTQTHLSQKAEKGITDSLPSGQREEIGEEKLTQNRYNVGSASELSPVIKVSCCIAGELTSGTHQRYGWETDFVHKKKKNY